MEKVLITGAGGFIGRAVVAAALRNPDWEIHAVVSGKRNHSFPEGVQVHYADLSGAEECERLLQEAEPGILIHLAWGMSNIRTECSAQDLIWVENSLRLLRLFFEYGGRRFVFAGSRTEYGEPKRQREDLESPVHRYIYGECKWGVEQICHNYCSEKGFDFVSARIFTVYGEGDDKKFPLIPAAIGAFHERHCFLCKEPNTVWDFVHVDDVAGALTRIAASNYCGPVNVGTGKPHLLRDVCTEIAEKMGCRDLLSFDEENRNASIVVADPTILRDEIGYQCRVSFSDGLERTITWWTKQLSVKL